MYSIVNNYEYSNHGLLYGCGFLSKIFRGASRPYKHPLPSYSGYATEGNVYKPFSEVYRTETTEKDRPSLQSSAEKQCHGMPFNPSAQFARNVAKTV